MLMFTTTLPEGHVCLTSVQVMGRELLMFAVRLYAHIRIDICGDMEWTYVHTRVHMCMCKTDK